MAVRITSDVEANLKILRTPPANVGPYSVAVPGSEVEGRSAIYRHWRFTNSPLLATVDPALRTAHDIFESSAKKHPGKKCLGERSYDGATKTWGNFVWQTYGQVAERRRNFGVGIAELHRQIGVTDEKYGVGLWCQNRPEWQITGKSLPSVCNLLIC